MSLVEISWVPVKADAEGSPAAASLKALSSKMLAADGIEGAYRGKGFDNADEPPAIEMATVWASEAAQQAAYGSPTAEEAKKLVHELIDTSNPKVQPYHSLITFDGPWAAVAESPIVQVTAVFVPADVAKEEFTSTWTAATSSLATKPEGFKVGVAGWAKDSVDAPQFGGKVNVFVAASGWDSIDKARAAVAGNQDKFGDLKKYSKYTNQRHVVYTKEK